MWSSKDKIAGMLLMVLGLGAVMEGRTHQVGTLTQMGSGYFPVALGLVLLFIGFLILVTASQRREEAPLSAMIDADEGETAHLSLDHCPAPDLRGIACIVASMVCFIVLGHYLGLVAASFASVFVATVGDRSASLREALFLSLFMCALAVGLFHFVLHVQFPLFHVPVWKV